MREGSIEYDMLRNQIYATLRSQKEAQTKENIKQSGGFVQTIDEDYKVNYDRYFSMLIVVPEQVESWETVNVLNYFGFPF